MMERGFLVGCARSGTTLFQAMLATHSDITSFPETHFFDRLYWGRKANTLRSLRALWVMFEVGRWVGQPAPFLVRPHLRRRDYGKDYIRLLDDAARRRGARAWIEKTTSHALFIDKILTVAPNAKFIHIIRDGRAVVASLYTLSESNPQYWGWARSLDVCCDRWNRSVRASLKWKDHPNHRLYTYEALVSNTERILADACALFGLEFETAMLQFQATAGEVIATHEDWKSNATAALKSTGLERYNTIFSDAQRQRIERLLDPSPAL